MAIKDFFRSSQVIASSSLDSMNRDIESAEYIAPFVEDQERLLPHVDFGDPANFAKYGSAQEYYDQSIKHIYGEYPYDGSLKERYEWRNSATLLDLYIFDNRYPKTTGYAIFSSGSTAGWGANTGSVTNGYGSPAVSDYEYINFTGGPTSPYGSNLGTSSLSDVFGSKANVWDTTVTGSGTRESNLKTDLDTGITVEFWFKTGSLAASLTEKQVIFDLWNNESSGSATYGRFRIEVDGKAGTTRAAAPFRVTLLSGTAGLSTSSLDIGSNLDLNSFTDWNHYALTLINNGSNITTRLYVNGDLSETITTGSNISEIRNPLQANIGALLTGTMNIPAVASSNTAPKLGWGKLSGSLDEFRFWKVKRDSEQIGRYWFTNNVGGGTNTDLANTTLGVYYKFNEGIVGDTSVDNIVLDYSGRATNGTWTGYSSTSRDTGSAIVSASAGIEDLDPIMRPQHSSIVNLDAELELSGTVWDYENNSSLYYTMPSWIIDEDEGNGTTGELKRLTQIMSTYFDNLQLQIGELSKLNMAYYPSSSAQGELFKPYIYASRAVRSHGLEAPELFSNASVFEYYRNRNEDKEYAEDLQTIKSFIYNNIYNNLSNVYKSKGTEKSFRNLISCFGIDEDLIRLNAYADNQTYKFETKRRASSYKTKAVDFNHIDRFVSTVHQYADTSNANSVSYISGSATDSKTYEDRFPVTLEAEVVFPLKLGIDSKNKWAQEFAYTTASLFGMHTAIASASMDGTETDLTWNTQDTANFQVFAVRDNIGSNDAYFMLSASDGGMILGDKDLDNGITSSYFKDVYSDSKWNFAVRIKPYGYPQAFVSGAVDNGYNIEFYGVNYVADRKINEFEVVKTVTVASAEAFLTASKRAYVGAHLTNFTGTVVHSSDAKVTSLKYWFDYVSNTTIQNHAIDPSSFGPLNPSRDSFLLETDLANVQVPQIESLALYWDFDTVTGSDASGQFTVQDVSSGSVANTGSYSWLGGIVKYQHTGRGFSFPVSTTASVENQYLYAGRQQLPEVVYGDDSIRVFSQAETEIFTKETRPTKTYYAFEKSMYQVISDEIINYFASIAEFNNLIGEPVNRYRPEYKGLKYLRQLFFERVRNVPDLDKFVDYYKWLDATLETMLMQLVPASAQVSDGIDNVVESHILERSKYQSKFPTLEFNTPTPETGALGINHLLYNWRVGHHPYDGSGYGMQTSSCFYWKERAERNMDPLNKTRTGTAPAGVTSGRNYILSASYRVLERSYTTPYRYSVEKGKNLHGGINFNENRRIHFYRGANIPHGATDSTLIPINILVAFNIDANELGSCLDVIDPNEKKYYTFGTHMGKDTMASGTFDGVKGGIAMPFNMISASNALDVIPHGEVQGLMSGSGYHLEVQSKFLSGSQLVNLHSDGIGELNEVAMQGPFTEKYVGGHQGRHVRINGAEGINAASAGGKIIVATTVTLVNIDDEKLTITNTTGSSVIFTFDKDAAFSTGDLPTIGLGGSTTGTTLATNLAAAINHASTLGASIEVDKSSVTLLLTQAIAGTAGNTTISFTTSDANTLTITDFSGGTGGIVGGDGLATPYLDNQYSRPEAFRLLLGGGVDGLGAIGITGPDYGGPYPDQTRYRAWWFREETAKRPVNIRNILQTTASVDTVLSGVLQHGPIGNYEKTYQVVQTSGRSTNNPWFNDNGATLPPKYVNNLANRDATHGESGSIRMPTTTNVHTLIAVRPESTGSSAYWAPGVGARNLVARGNSFIPQASSSLDRGTHFASEQDHNLGRISNLYLPKATVAASASTGAITVFELPDRTKQDAVIVERFSAPGGPEINSLGFLDIMAAEKSVYNALPYRNLMVRGSGSGEPGEIIELGPDGSSRYVTRTATMHVVDHTGRLRGLQTLLSLHAGWGGIDGTYGVITDKGHTTGLQGLYMETASFHKVNRNRAIKIQADGTTGSVYDNWFVQHPIPQNDFQYAWISGSILAGTATSVVGAANQGGIGHAPKSGRSGQYGFLPARATVTFTGVPTNDETITIVNTVGLSKAYIKKASANTSADPPQFHGASAAAVATSLKACIEAATGHNGTITVHDNAAGVLTLTQVAKGTAGNTVIAQGLSNATATDFTGGGNGDTAAITFVSGSQPDYSASVVETLYDTSKAVGFGTPVDFVGLNTVIYDPTGSAHNILGTSSNDYGAGNPVNDTADPRIYRNLDIVSLRGQPDVYGIPATGSIIVKGNTGVNWDTKTLVFQGHNGSGDCTVGGGALETKTITFDKDLAFTLGEGMGGSTSFTFKMGDGAGGFAATGTIASNLGVLLNTVECMTASVSYDTVPDGTIVHLSYSIGLPSWNNQTITTNLAATEATVLGFANSRDEARFGRTVGTCFNALMLHRNGPYGYPSWKQIRGGEHSLVRQMNKANTISIINPLTERSYARQQAGGYMGYKWAPQGLATIEDIYGESVGPTGGPTYRPWITASTLAYHEPAVIFHTPMVFETDLNSPGLSVTASPTLQPVSWNATYANQKQYFVNSKLNENLGIDTIGGHTAGDILVDAFANDQLNSTLNTIKYSESIYPKKTNLYRDWIRERTSYQPTFWRTTREDRSVIRPYHVRSGGSIAQTIPPSGFPAALALSQSLGIPIRSVFSQGAMMATSSMWPLDPRLNMASGTREQGGRNNYPEHGDSNSIDTGGGVPAEGGGAGTSGSSPNPKVWVASGSIYSTRPGGGDPGDADWIYDGQQVKTGGEGELQNCITTVHSAHIPIQGASYTTGSVVARYHITASATYNRRHTIVTGSSILAWSSVYGPKDPAGNPTRRRNQYPKQVVPFAGDAAWDAGRQSGKEPFYNSYGDYARDMQIRGKDYSILPEYRMSDRIGDFLANDRDPFNDANLFSLTGALANTTSSQTTEFYKTYSHTDFMKYFGVVETNLDTKLNAAATQISLSCKGLLKLLPYDGFYPALRTVQLASLFSQSYGANVTLTGAAPSLDAVPAASFWRAFLTPMFAPGLMFNTIKSGIAVDFPIFTKRAPEIGRQATGITHDAYVISSPKFDKRVPFEALVAPEAHLANEPIYDMEVHPSCSFSGSAAGANGPKTAVRALWNGQGDNRYKLAMHNFLAETPEFFLDNGTFTTFISAPKSRWNPPNHNLSYKMRVKLRKSYISHKFSSSLDRDGSLFINKTGDVYPQIVSGSETIVMYSRPSAFGPPCGGGPRAFVHTGHYTVGTAVNTKLEYGFFGDSTTGYNPAFTPAYYDGEAWADLEYNPGLYPDESALPNLDVLLSRITASYLRFAGPLNEDSTLGAAWRYGLGGPATASSYESRREWSAGNPRAGSGYSGPLSGAWECNTNSNQVSSSINLFGTTKGLQDILKYQGVDLGANEDQWVIQSKYETPILNFIDNSGAVGLDAFSTTQGSVAAGMTKMAEDFNVSEVSGGLNTRPIGMWHQYGRLPKGSEGIYLEIADVAEPGGTNDYFRIYPAATRTPMAGVPDKTGSLAELVGFAKRSEKLGRVAQTKTIREAVVAVPFVEEGSLRQFFALQRSQIKYILGMGDGSREPGEDNMVTPGQSITDMVQAMQRYVFPPSMDFINYINDVTPFAMYIFEFSHDLNQQDLVDIWQNLPPRIGRAFDPKESLASDEIVKTQTLSHPIATGELLGDTNNMSQMRWMVFKVKQRAQTNYFRKVAQENTDLAVQPTLGAAFRNQTLNILSTVAQGAAQGALQKTQEFKQTYNWPYDFFSLVELAKIDDEITFAPVIPQPPLATVTGDTTNVRPGNLSAVYNHTHTYTIDANGNGTTDLVTVSTPLGIDAHSHQIVNFTLSEHTDAYGYGPHNHDILGSSGGTGGGTVGPPPGGSGGGAGGGTVGAPPNGGAGGGTATGPGTTGPGSPGGGGTGTGTGMQVTTTGQGGAGGGTGGTGATGLPTQGTPPSGGGGGGFGGGGGGGGYGPK